MMAKGGTGARTWRPTRDGYGQIERGPGDPVAVHAAIERVRAGDHQALRVLYTEYSETIRRYATVLLGDADLAEDVTQSTFLKLLRVLHRYERRDTPFEAWLLRVARNVAFDLVRQRRRQTRDEWIPEEPSRGEDSQTEARQALTEALAALPAAQREVILLRHVVGLSTGEIAERLGRSEAAVNNLHHRARMTLQVALRMGGTTPGTRRRTAPDPDDGRSDPGADKLAPGYRARRFERVSSDYAIVDIVD